jgi:hypothetical protein
MINQRHCPYCKAAAIQGCAHLAVAVEARDFVRRCIESCQGHLLWETLCDRRREQQRLESREDFTWLETAFCDQFLKHLRWFGGIDYEWRTGPKLEQGGFWVLLWSKEPRQLWWELRDEIERRVTLPALAPAPDKSPSLLWLTPR